MNVIQPWVSELTMMQQTVLFTTIRGPDGGKKRAAVKMLLRWYRRCVLLSAIDGRILSNPYENNGGSFTGPSYETDSMEEHEDWPQRMDEIVGDYLRDLDTMPLHFHMHLMHASQVLGYKHPDPTIKNWWQAVYIRFVDSFHLRPESEADMDGRLGDSREGWLRRADPATL